MSSSSFSLQIVNRPVEFIFVKFGPEIASIYHIVIGDERDITERQSDFVGHLNHIVKSYFENYDSLACA